MRIPNWLNAILENIRKTRKAYPEVYIFSAITAGVLFFFIYISYNNRIGVLEINAYHISADSTVQERLNTSARVDSINLCKNLKVVYSYINELKKAKFFLAKMYQKYLIVCFTIGVFFVTLTAVMAFVVTKKGWDNSSRIRKGLLLSCAFYGLLLTAFPKLFDQDQNFRNNFSDYNALSNAQMFIFKRLSPYLDKKDNVLQSKDSAVLLNAMDTVTAVVMHHSNIDISLDKNQLDAKKIEF